MGRIFDDDTNALNPEQLHRVITRISELEREIHQCVSLKLNLAYWGDDKLGRLILEYNHLARSIPLLSKEEITAYSNHLFKTGNGATGGINGGYQKREERIREQILKVLRENISPNAFPAVEQQILEVYK